MLDGYWRGGVSEIKGKGFVYNLKGHSVHAKAGSECAQNKPVISENISKEKSFNILVMKMSHQIVYLHKLHFFHIVKLIG